MKRNGHVLIVDAVANNRIVFRSILASAGYHVAVAADVPEAVERMKAREPDLVVAALDLPDNGTNALFARMRTLKASPAILAIAADTIEARVAAFDIGADDVVSQPPDQELLLSRVRALLRVRKSNLLEEMFSLSRSGLSDSATPYAPPLRLLVVGADADRSTAVQNALIRVTGSECQRRAPGDTPAASDLGRFDGCVLVADPAAAQDQTLAQLQAIRASAPGKAAVLILAVKGCPPDLAAKALDLGVDDVVDGLADAAEMGRRIKARLRTRRSLPSSCRDLLTGLPNARYTKPMIARHAAMAARTHSAFAVLLAELTDVDKLRARHGHNQVEAAIAEIAARLRVTLPHGLFLSKLSQTEFLVLMPDTGGAAARRMALRLCHSVSETPCGIPGTQESIAANLAVGVALSPLSGGGTALCQTESLLKNARDALAQAQHATHLSPVLISRPAA